jgi:hypothetical protein
MHAWVNRVAKINSNNSIRVHKEENVDFGRKILIQWKMQKIRQIDRGRRSAHSVATFPNPLEPIWDAYIDHRNSSHDLPYSRLRVFTSHVSRDRKNIFSHYLNFAFCIRMLIQFEFMATFMFVWILEAGL